MTFCALDWRWTNYRYLSSGVGLSFCRSSVGRFVFHVHVVSSRPARASERACLCACVLSHIDTDSLENRTCPSTPVISTSINLNSPPPLPFPSPPLFRHSYNGSLPTSSLIPTPNAPLESLAAIAVGTFGTSPCSLPSSLASGPLPSLAFAPLSAQAVRCCWPQSVGRKTLARAPSLWRKNPRQHQIALFTTTQHLILPTQAP